VVAGLVRYVCLVLVALALVERAVLFTAEDIASATSLQQPLVRRRLEGITTAISFPPCMRCRTPSSKKSLLGPFIKGNLSMLLINSRAATVKKTAHS
jgi:hypothetical protein